MMYFSRIRIKPDIGKNTQLSNVLAGSAYNVHRLLWDLFPENRQRKFLFRTEIAREQLGLRPGVRGEPLYYVVSTTRPLSETLLFDVKTKEYQPKLFKGELINFELRANPVVTQKLDRQKPEKYLKERSRRRVGNSNKLTKKRVRHDVVMDAQFRLLSELEHIFAIPSKGDKSRRIKKIKRTFQESPNKRASDHLKASILSNERFRASLIPDADDPKLLVWALKARADTALETWLNRKSEQNGFQLVRGGKDDLLKFQAESYRWHSLPQKGRKAGFSSVDFEGVLQVMDPVLMTESLFNGIGPAKAFGCGLMLVRRI